jgi:surfeit locus 1 family protein
MSPRARSLLFLAGSLVAALVFVRLGLWQLHRLERRRALNRPAAAARAQPVVSFDDPVEAAGLIRSGLENRRVRVTGRYDHAAEIVLRGQSEEGVPGVRIVTPLRPLRGDTAILVQRGFVASPDAWTVTLSELEEPGVHEVTGIAFLQPDSGVAGQPAELDGRLTWHRIDLRAIRERLPYPVHSFILLQLLDPSLPLAPRRDQPPPLSDGPHLGYAIQWFAAALIALGFGGFVGFRRTGPAARPAGPQHEDRTD